jgi:hypothetical protein
MPCRTCDSSEQGRSGVRCGGDRGVDRGAFAGIGKGQGEAARVGAWRWACGSGPVASRALEEAARVVASR